MSPLGGTTWSLILFEQNRKSLCLKQVELSHLLGITGSLIFPQLIFLDVWSVEKVRCWSYVKGTALGWNALKVLVRNPGNFSNEIVFEWLLASPCWSQSFIVPAHWVYSIGFWNWIWVNSMNCVPCQAHGERNYHVFYELLAGLPAEQKEKMYLQEAESYFYLNQVSEVRMLCSRW